MRNYTVTVKRDGVDSSVIVSNIQQATGLTSTYLIRNCAVECVPTTEPVTHKNTQVAAAYIDMRLMGFDIGIAPKVASCASH